MADTPNPEAPNLSETILRIAGIVNTCTPGDVHTALVWLTAGLCALEQRVKALEEDSTARP